MKTCKKCGRKTKIIKRQYCNTCYEYARLHNVFVIKKKCNVNKLNAEQKEHILGSLLGDGAIEMGKLAKNARLCIYRQTKDKDYVKWQALIFNNLCEDNCLKHSIFFDKRTNKYYYRTYFRTRNCPIITEYWKKWYPNKIKIVPRDIVFSPISLLIWFLDDGCFHFDKSKNCSVLRLDLSTMGFTKDENIVLSQKGKYYLRLTNIPARKFISIIDPIFPDCMIRKAKWRNNDCDYYTKLFSKK